MTQATKTVSTAEAFYRVFRALPKRDRLDVARYILTDEEVQKSLGLTKIPNEITLKVFAENKEEMPVFETIDELQKDLSSWDTEFVGLLNSKKMSNDFWKEGKI